MQFDLSNEARRGILEAKNYAEFKKYLADSNCNKCRLADARTHIVVDRGNPSADVVLIGEAPGENEDLQGKAFVGRAGKLLDEMMKTAGFNTNEDSLVVNVVKCRPPENRRPKPEEVNQCFPFLKMQIEFVKPKLILLLGATALRHVVAEKKQFSMEKEAGNFFTHTDYPNTQLMVFYHPAFILRDPRKKPIMAEHVRKFVAMWKRLSS